MTGKRLRMAAAISAVVLSMLVLIALNARVNRSSEDNPNAIALKMKDQEGFELHTSSRNDIETQLRARKSKGKKGKGKHTMQSEKKSKKSKRVYKIAYPKYSVIMPYEVTYTSGATDRKGQIVVEDWRQG
jgi:hypothetical protein